MQYELEQTKKIRQTKQVENVKLIKQQQQIEIARITKKKTTRLIVETFACKRCFIKFANNIKLHNYIRDHHTKKHISFVSFFSFIFAVFSFIFSFLTSFTTLRKSIL